MGPKMQGAIMNGLYNISAPFHFTCSTGNCQWDAFSTLAVTSTCRNVTSESEIVCERLARGAKSCNYTTPLGLRIESSYVTSSGGGNIVNFNLTALDMPTFGGRFSSNEDNGPNDTLATFAIANMRTPFSLEKPDVTECTMRWCARIMHNLRVENGIMTPGESEDVELSGIRTPFDSPGGSNRLWITFNVSDAYQGFLGNRSFSISARDDREIKTYLHSLFTSQKSDPLYLPILNSTNLTETVAMISSSMTYAFGQSPSGTEVPGQAIASEQYISVKWPWLSLPLIEVIMGIAFLVCTLVYTRQRGVIAWKSSGIVPLVTTMDGWDSRELRATSWRDMEKRSKSMHGRLVPNSIDRQLFQYRDK